MCDTDEFRNFEVDRGEMKPELKLIIRRYRRAAAILGLQAIILVGVLTLVISSGGSTISPLLAFGVLYCVGLAWLYWKVADLLSVDAEKGWWRITILNETSSLSPIPLIIPIYMWLRKTKQKG